MSKKENLLTEVQVRQFMKLANLEPLSAGFVDGLGESHGRGKREGAAGYGHEDQNSRLEEQLPGEEELPPEEPGLDEPGLDEPGLDEPGLEDPLDEPLEDVGGGREVSVDDFLAALEVALEDVLGDEVEVDQEDDVEEEPVEEPMGMEAELGDAPADEPAPELQEMIDKITKRVAKRIVQEALQDKKKKSEEPLTEFNLPGWKGRLVKRFQRELEDAARKLQPPGPGEPRLDPESIVSQWPGAEKLDDEQRRFLTRHLGQLSKMSRATEF